MKVLFVLYSLNNYILFWIMAWNVHIVPLPIYFSISVKIGTTIKRNCIFFPFTKWNFINNSRKYGKFGIDLVDAMLNTLWTLEMATFSELISTTWKYYHTQWSQNISQWFIYEVIVKYVIQGPECVKQGINPICANVTSFLKLLKEFHFLEWALIISFNFSPYYRSSV